MKRLLKLLLALLLTLSLVGFKSSDTLDLSQDTLSKEQLSQLKPSQPPQKVDEEGRPLFLSKEEVLETSDSTELLRVVVELEGEPVVVTATKLKKSVDELSPSQVKAQQKALRNEQKAVKQALQKAGIKVSSYGQTKKAIAADQSFTVSFNGFSAYIVASDIEKLEKVAGVKAVYLANEYLRPDVSKQQYTSVNQVWAPIAWGYYGYDGTGQVVAVVDSGIDPGHPDFVLSDASKAALDQSEVAALGLPGSYYTEKVPYAYNYYDLSQQVKDLGGSQHGQHVAGSVAANGKIRGVAPEAQLLGMKVFSDDVLYATTFSDIYLKAIDDAVALGADALNMSLGSPSGFYVMGSAEDVAINNALANGVLSTISSGNEHNSMNGAANFANFLAQAYPYANHKNPDVGVTGSPSVNAGSLSVASVDNTNLVAHRLDYSVDGETQAAQMTPAAGSPEGAKVLPGPQPVVKVGIGTAQDFAVVGDAVKGKVALVMRGNTFTDSLANAQAAGASALIVYNHTTGGEGQVNMAGGDGAKIPFVFIGNSAGNAMSTALSEGKEVTVTFTSKVMAVANPTANEISSFSSWGATPDLQIKPEITAPGGQIYSTQNGDKYTTMSGTSMAAPHAAGGAAVVAQRLKEEAAFAGLTPAQRAALVKVLLMNTATPLVDPAYGGSYVPYPVRAQGAGLMNVAKAVDATVYVVEANSGQPKVEVGSIDKTSFSVKLTLTNVSDSAQEFALDSMLLRDYYQTVGGVTYNLEGGYPISHTLGGPETVVVPAKGSATITLSVDFSKAVGTNPATSLTRNQFVDGYIYLDSVDASHVGLVVPVLAFYGDWEEPRVLDELRWNLLDTDPKNNPTFVLTTPVYTTEEGDLYFANPNPTIWMSPNSGEVGDTIGFLGTVLRNAEEIDFRVRDLDGKVVRELGESSMQRKIYRMAQGSAPYRYFAPSAWDGTLNGKVPSSGSEYLYEVEVKRTKTSAPQTMQFHVTIDTLGPEVSAVSYDPETKVLSFALADAGVGVDTAMVALRKNLSQVVGAEVDVDGVWHADVSSLVVQESNAQLLIVAFDGLGNPTVVRVSVKSDKVKPEPVAPEQPPVTPPVTPPTTPPERPNDPYGEVQIVLTAPDLLEAYATSQVRFTGWVYGVPEVSSLTFGDHSLTLTPVEKASIYDLGGQELYYGLAYRFDEVLTLADGYYEKPLEVKLPDETSFQIVRRFWVDTTAPTLKAVVSKVEKGATHAAVELHFGDNLSVVEVYRDDNYLTTVDLTGQGFGSTDVVGTYSDQVELLSKPSKVVYKAVDIAGNVHQVTVNLPKK